MWSSVTRPQEVRVEDRVEMGRVAPAADMVCMGMIDSDTGLLGRGTVAGAGGLAVVFREKLPGLAVGL